ncbi:hypothetical protein N665_1990s0001 [Sinapis alba]|nr:hypothetical protein N665_1990s0001 [Sinapis alba]
MILIPLPSGVSTTPIKRPVAVLLPPWRCCCSDSRKPKTINVVTS